MSRYDLSAYGPDPQKRVGSRLVGFSRSGEITRAELIEKVETFPEVAGRFPQWDQIFIEVRSGRGKTAAHFNARVASADEMRQYVEAALPWLRRQ